MDFREARPWLLGLAVMLTVLTMLSWFLNLSLVYGLILVILWVLLLGVIVGIRARADGNAAIEDAQPRDSVTGRLD